MLIQISDRHEIIAYTIVGGLSSSVEYSGTVPDDFEEKFRPSFYLLKNDEIVENPDFVEPEPPVVGPSDMQQMIMQQASTITQMQKIIMQQSQDIAELKGVQA